MTCVRPAQSVPPAPCTPCGPCLAPVFFLSPSVGKDAGKDAVRATHCPMAPFSRMEWQSMVWALLNPVLPCWNGELLVELFVVRDGVMAALNLQNMGCYGPTNILSFPAKAGGQPWAEIAALAHKDVAQMGTLVLGVDTLRRECLLYGQEMKEHALRLLAHGLGHLMGHDHGPAMDELCTAMLASVLDGNGRV